MKYIVNEKKISATAWLPLAQIYHLCKLFIFHILHHNWLLKAFLTECSL